VTEFEPLEIRDLGQLQQGLFEEAPNELASYDQDISRLLVALGPLTWESMGYNAHSRTSSLLWASCSEPERKAEVAQELSDDLEDGVLEHHLQFLDRRRLGFLYLVDGSSEGELWLHLGERQQAPLVLPGAGDGRLLVFRCDLMNFEYRPRSSRCLVLLAWALDFPRPDQTDEVSDQPWHMDELLGLRSRRGPSVPRNECGRVLGMSCFTGGGADSLTSSECLYLQGCDAHTRVPFARFDTDVYFSKDGEVDHVPWANSYHCHGALAPDEEVLSFDAKFFGISDAEASIMPPNQRKTLEVAYDCLRRGGHTKKTLRGSNILVHMGDCGSEWWSLICPRMLGSQWTDDKNVDWNAARSFSVTASRLSHVLGLTGPTWLLDTACSAGLTAVCTAMFSLKGTMPAERSQWSSSLEQRPGCLAGGVNVISDPGVYIANSAMHMLSPKGRCFTFDGSGDGYARGEGCSIAYIVMSNRDRDIELQEGSIVGSAVNQDGRSASMTAPNGPAQQMCVKAALREANLRPSDITASECHGTGTALGDPIEIGSLRAVQETDGQEGAVLLCTSSKSNIGHLEANAGVAGLFKCIIMSKYAVALPNCHLRALNPHLAVDGWPAQFEGEVVDYAADSGIVGVSSFGVSGTNAHAEVWSATSAHGNRGRGSTCA
ncbi:unnamed protein product, partial [Polarella glacialis]